MGITITLSLSIFNSYTVCVLHYTVCVFYIYCVCVCSTLYCVCVLHYTVCVFYIILCVCVLHYTVFDRTTAPGVHFFPRIFDPAVKQAGFFIRTQKRSQVMHDKPTCFSLEPYYPPMRMPTGHSQIQKLCKGHLTTLKS